MSARTARAARNAVASRPTVALRIDTPDVIEQFLSDGGMEATPDRDPAEIRYRLGRKHWGPPTDFAGGWSFQRFDSTAMVIVTAAIWPDLPGVPVVHASISRHNPTMIPTYEDLQLLHQAVWPDGNAMQAFVPAGDHVNLRENVVHLWGRSDNERLWPIDFGRYGTI